MQSFLFWSVLAEAAFIVVLLWHSRNLSNGADSASRRIDSIIEEWLRSKAETESRLDAIESAHRNLAECHADLVRQVGIVHSENARDLGILDAATRTAVDRRFADLKALIQATSENYSLKLEDFNLRLIDIETENKNPVPVKREDEDLMNGPRSWAAQAAAAERAEGVSISA